MSLPDLSEFENLAPPPLAEDDLAGGYELDEFTIEDVESSKRLSGMAVITVLAAYATRCNGGDFSFIERNVSDWDLPMFIKLSQAATGLTTKYAKNVSLGVFSREDYMLARTFSLSTLKYSLRAEKIASTESHTSSSLADHIYAVKGNVAYTNGSGLDTRVRIDIPGYTNDARVPIEIGVFGDEAGCVVNGAKEYVDWFNANHNNQIKYLPVPDLVRKLSGLVHQRVQIVVDANGAILFKDRVIPPCKIKSIYLVKSCETFVRAACTRMTQVWREPKDRPSWAPTGKREYDVIEWLMTKAYVPIFEDVVKKAGASRLFSTVQEEIQAQENALWKELGAMGVTYAEGIPEERKKAAMLDVLKSLWQGTVRPYNSPAPLVKYGQANDMVETSRNQERQHDFVTTKVDLPPLGRFAGSHSSVPFKIKNAIGQLLSAVGEKERYSEVDVIGMGKESHFESMIEGVFHDTPIVFSDVNPAYGPRLGGKFVRRDVLDPKDMPPNSGVNKLLISDVFPGTQVSKASFGIMMSNYLAARYSAGIVKLYLGSDLEADTFIRYGVAPKYIEDWAKEYKVIGLAPGGGAHTQEYFFIFAKRAGDWKSPGLWVPGPPTASLPRYRPDVILTSASCQQHVDGVNKYASLFFSLKVMDMVRSNAWKASRALNGVRGVYPSAFGEKGPALEYLTPGTKLRLTGKGTTLGVTSSDGPQTQFTPLNSDLSDVQL